MIWNLTKTEKDKAQITIYGPIKDFSSFFSSAGASPDKIMRDLDELVSAKELTLRINSGGGSAFAGFAIFELIRAHGGKVISRIDGVAASAASIIAMAGDKIIMGTGAMMMVHNPWTRVEGNATELREAADMLDRVSESLVNVYQARTGKNREELRAMLDKTTWLTADEAIEMGFADEIDKKFTVAASIQGSDAVFNDQRFDLGIFAEVPQLPVKAEEPEPIPDPEPQKVQEPIEPKDKEDDIVENLDELKAKHPGIYQSAIQAGAEQERIRIQAIDEIAPTVPKELVTKAKYEEPKTAQELAFDAMKAHAAAGTTFINQREAELETAKDVPGATPVDQQKQEEAATVDAIANSINKKRQKGDNQ